MNALRCSPSLARTAVAAMLASACTATAGQAVITFTPLTPTTLAVPADGEAVVEYLATNQSVLARTFVMTPIAGVDIDTTAGHCADPFLLAAHQSCTLSLRLIGSAMTGDIDGGPVVCINGSPTQCWQPSAADQLHVTLVPTQVATIDATPTTLTIALGTTAPITVTNAVASPVAAQDLAIDVPPASSIVVDAGACTGALAPGASCTFHIGGTAAETETVLAISGSNTTPASVTVTLFDDTVFADGLELSPPA